MLKPENTLIMRLILSLFAISFLTISGYSTNPDDIYLTKQMEVTDNKKEASYVCEIVNESERGYQVKAYFMTGELKMEGWFKEKELTTPHGEFVFYYQNGQVESEGEFMEGSKFGLWERFDFEGNPKPEKIYATSQMMEAISEE